MKHKVNLNNFVDINEVSVILPSNFYQIYLTIQKKNRGLEWSWFHNIETHGNTINLVEMCIPEQENTATTTETMGSTEEALFFTENGFAWGHSHHTMSTNPSTQDETTVDEYIENYKEGGYFVRLIVSYDTININVYKEYYGFPLDIPVKEILFTGDPVDIDIDSTINKLKKRS